MQPVLQLQLVPAFGGVDRVIRAKFRALIKQMQLYFLNKTALAHQRSGSDPGSLYTMFMLLSLHNCTVLKDL